MHFHITCNYNVIFCLLSFYASLKAQLISYVKILMKRPFLWQVQVLCVLFNYLTFFSRKKQIYKFSLLPMGNCILLTSGPLSAE